VILLDTHVVVWLAEMPEELSVGAVAALRRERGRDGLAISDQSLWELAWAIAKGRMRVLGSVGDFLGTVERTFTVLPVTAAVAEQAASLSELYPKDPVDRVIGATALVHGIELITRDVRIRASGEVPCVW